MGGVLTSERLRPVRTVGAAALRRLPIPAWATIQGGRKLRVELSSSVGRSIWLRHEYEPEMHAILERHLAAGDCFIDVGANVGYFSVVAADLVGAGGEVHAFEPVARCVSMLRRTVERGDLEQVHIVPAAAWSKRDRLHLESGRDDAFARSKSGSGATMVDAVSLDDYVAEHVRSPVRLVKVDVEGAELHVLHGMRGLLSTQRPVVIAEANHWMLSVFGHDLDGLYRYLAEVGYAAADLAGHSLPSPQDAYEMQERAWVRNMVLTPCR